VPVTGTGPGLRLQSPAMLRRLFTVAILTIVFIVVAVVIGADIGARVYAEHQIADRAKASTGAQSSSASINSFPFLWDLLVEGKANKVTVHLKGVPVGPLRFDRVDVKAQGVHIDTGYLISHQKARITSMDSADATLTLTAATLSTATGVHVSISGNTVTASVAGVDIPVTVGVSGGHTLTLSVDGRSFGFDLERSPIIPPCDMQLTTANDAITLGCHVSPVPASVVAAISAASST
jgi:hypothetical protein